MPSKLARSASKFVAVWATASGVVLAPHPAPEFRQHVRPAHTGPTVMAYQQARVSSVSWLMPQAPQPPSTSTTALAQTSSGATSREVEMTAKLVRIAQLKDGWWGPGSRAITPSSIAVATAVLPVACERHTHIAIAPHASGSLMLEWSFGDVEVTVELRPDGSMVLTQDNVVSDEYIEETVAATEGDLSRFILASTE